MEVATTPPAAEVAQESVTFFAQCHNLRLVRKPEVRTMNFQGIVVDITPSVAVEFVEGRVTLEDPSMIEWMRGHNKFNVPGGFWEEGAPPEAPLPHEKDQLAAIVRATATHDARLLLEVIEVEEATHERQSVLLAARTAAGAIEAALAEKAEAEARARAEQAKADAEAAAAHEREVESEINAKANGNGATEEPADDDEPAEVDAEES
jgi:hypothetical protein